MAYTNTPITAPLPDTVADGIHNSAPRKTKRASKGKNFRTTLFPLALVLLVLSALIGYLFWKDQAAATRWVLMPEASVDTIDIVTKGLAEARGEDSNRMRLTSKNDSWLLTRTITTTDGTTETLNVPANSDRVAPLLSLLHLPQRTSYAVDEVELPALGLMPPRATVTINELEFLFGDMTADNTARYVQVAGRVHLYSEMVYPLINAGAGVFTPTTN